MARYAYDVNTTTRLIDVHKQFQGGLKTVDTDDSLGAVFLRQAENVSLSEFGFIEKRYGTFEKFKKQIQGTLQGYWEFEGHLIFAVDGYLYVDNIDSDSKVLDILKEIEDEDSTNYEKEWRYPDVSDFYPLQTTRDMNAININKVLYIFTGTYPIYAAIIENQLKFYWFSMDVPSYNEIVVVGHNLLEDDYENVYAFSTPNDYDTGSAFYSSASAAKPEITKIDYYPRIPFQENDGEKGNLNFSIDYSLPSVYKQDYKAPLSDGRYRRLSLKDVRYRTSGAGASLLDFTSIDLENVDFEDVDNDNSILQRTTLDEGLYYDKIQINSSELQYQTNSISFETGQTSYATNYTLTIEEDFSKEYIDNHKDFVFKFFLFDTNLQNPFIPTTFEDLIIDNPLNNFKSEYYIEVTPYDINNQNLEKSKVKIPSSDIDSSDNQYRFTIPANILSSSFVAGYKIEFYNAFEVGHEAGVEEVPYVVSDFYKTFATVKKLDFCRNFSDEPLLDFSISDLLSGTFDFEIIFSLKEYNEDDNGFLTLFSEKQFSNILFDVTITPEKLQDYPGSEGVPIEKEAVWSCNKVIEHFGKLMIWGSTKMPNSVFYSFPDRPTFFPSKFYLDFQTDGDDPVQAITPYMNILVVQTENITWGVRGNSGILDSPSPYIPFTINSTVGTIAYKSVRPVRNHLFFLSKQGIIALKSLYAADEQYNIEFVDRNIKNIVPQDYQAVGIQFDNQYWLNFPNFGITLRWYIDKKGFVLDSFGSHQNKITDVFVSKQGAWSQFNGVFKWQIINGKLEFITLPSALNEGENLSVYKVGVDYSLPTDLGKNVFTKIETSFLNQNYPFHPKNYKELKLDFTLQNEYNSTKTFIYSMDEREDISDDVHKIDNVSILKNHKYRIVYNFSQHTTDEIILNGGNFLEALPTEINGGSFDDNSTVTIIGGFTFSLLNAKDLQIKSVRITDKNNEQITLLENEGFTITENPDTYDEYIEFLVPNSIDGIVDIIVNGDFSLYNDGAVMFDITYDANLQIKNWVVSESATLNIEDFSVPDPSKVALDLDFDSSLGQWVFGSSDFGSKVTAVKTVKLSGKGYNAKLYLEDETKSKWTLESIGLTYKMKRARSR